MLTVFHRLKLPEGLFSFSAFGPVRGALEIFM